jgi:hypothetical protein
MSTKAPQIPLSEKVMLTVPEAAAVLSVSVDKLYQFINKGIVPVVDLDGIKRVPHHALLDLAGARECIGRVCPTCGGPMAAHHKALKLVARAGGERQ